MLEQSGIEQPWNLLGVMPQAVLWLAMDSHVRHKRLFTELRSTCTSKSQLALVPPDCKTMYRR